MRKFDLSTFTENRFMVCTVKEGSHMYQEKRENFETKNLALIPSGVLSLSDFTILLTYLRLPILDPGFSRLR